MANKKKKLTDVLEETTNQRYTPSNDIAPVRTSKSKIDTLIDNSAIGRIRNVWDDGYQFGDATRTILGVMNDNPIGNFNRNAVESGMDLTKSLFTGEGKFVKGNKATEKIKEIWDDGYQFGDIAESKNQITKTILGTTGDVAGRLIKGELQTAEGLVDTARYFSGDIYEKLGMKQFAEEEREKAKQNTTGFILGENDLYNNKKENGWSKKIDEYSLFGDRMDSIVESVGQQAFRIGLQQAVGSAGASEGTTKALNQLEIFAGSYGSAKSEALQNGADNKTATIRGIISGTSETISENLFDNIPGFKTGQIKGASTVKDIIGKSTEKVFGKEAGKLILRTFNAAGEGLEEIISNSLETASTDVVNYFMPEYTYGMEEGQGIEGNTFGEKAKKLFKDVFKSSKSDESKEAFITSFISTLITGGLTDGMTEVQKNQVIKAYAKDNNISVKDATKLFDGITELRMQEITDEATGYEDRINTENNLKQQLTQELRTNQNLNLQELQEGLIARDKFIKAIGTGVVSSKGLDLNESYKAYGGDVKYKNQIANIQKFMNNRNIDARFDATMFDNNEQNALWTTENGKDSVIFNPKASADQIIQSIATHEMTHDIIAQKTEAGTSLFNDVLENIKNQKDYAKQRKEIEDLYAKYYDRNSKDFAAKVDEEMVANELGKNLGTQEYINRLVNEKPNLAKRIYNWVVDKLDNIGKSAEYKEQKAYWKSVADKFEVAYNEQKTATGEDRTAYSLNDYEVYQNELNETLNKAKNIGEDFYNNLKNQTDEYKERHPLEYNIYEQTKSRPATDENYNSDFFKEHRSDYDGKSGTNTADGRLTVLHLQKGDNLAKLSFIENQDKIWIDELYVKNQKQGYGSEIVNAIKDYAERTGKYVEAFKELQTAKGFWDKTLRNNTRYSLTKDSQGRVNEDADNTSFSLVESEPIHATVKGEYKTYDNYYDFAKDITKNNNELAKELLLKNYTYKFEIPVGKNETSFYHGGDSVVDYDTYKIMEFDEHTMDRNYGDYFYITTDKSFAHSYGNNIAQFIIPNNKIISLEDFNKSGMTEEQAFNKYWVIEAPNNEYIVKDVNAIINYSKQKALDFINNQENTATNYSLTLTKDSQGRTLSKEQQEYFKDSKIRDAEGRLMPMYHGTLHGGFTIFERKSRPNMPGAYFSNTTEYTNTFAGIKKETGDYYDSLKEGIQNGVYTPQTYEVYLNVTNPLILSLEEQDTIEDIGYWENIYNSVKEQGYDGVMMEDMSQVFVFNQNQIKNIDNTTPTSNPDIRYSLTKDNTGRELSEGQREYFKDSKVVDEDGNLLRLYHGGEQNYNVFRSEFDEYYFTPDENAAQDYGSLVRPFYLNFTNPYEVDFEGRNDKANDLYENGVFDVIDYAKENGYDGAIIRNTYDGANTHDQYVAFAPNQIKNVDNLNPTSSEDIRYSMQQEETPFTEGTRTTMGELFENNIAPIREDLNNITEQMNNLSNQIETLQNQLETTPQGYVETYNEQRNENIPTRQLTEEDANTLQDALMNDEGYLRSLDEEANIEKNDKLINKITNDIQVKLGLSKNQRTDLQDIIKDAVDNDLTTEEISDKLYSKFNQQEYTYTNEEAKEAKKLIRNTPLKVSDGIKTDIADYNAFKRSNFGKINFSRNGLPVDVAYAQLSEQNPAFFPSDIINPTEQLLKIADVANTMNEITETYQIMPDEFDDMADFIRDSIVNDTYENQMQSQYDLDKNIQFDMNGELVPTTVRTQESIDNFIENRDIAPVRQETQRQRSNLRERIDTLRRSLQEKFINRNYIIDEFSKASGNREIKYAGDNLNNVSSETQFNVNNKQTDINGKWIGKGVHEIFEPARKTGLYEAFNDYLIQKSNIERHNVGKGSQVPLVVSQQLVAQYENENPQFKEWAKDVYKYFDNVLQEQVDAGLITEDKYKDYRGEHGIYRSYVPFYEGELDINRYFDNEGNVRPVSTLKRSKGNATDVNQMLAVEDSMARQTYAYKRAIRQNELYREIVNSLDKYSDAMDIDVRNEPTNLDDSLYTTENGDKVLSAYVNGEKISAIISDELYNELSQDNENRIKQMEEDFSLITRPLQKASDVRRKILTSWNPTFLARNAIKDIQDAAINSKHTKDMLANYFGIKKGQKAAIFELNDAKTETAQQFLALYGSDNLYGDYSRKGNWFTKTNELIELAPRYAEFKATLQNGGTIQEAIYNAREVTTNFGRGGYITKALNRNGFTFLNANVQGLDKIVRNLSGENGIKGVTTVVAKGIAFAMLPSILNELLYGIGDDKDEEYEALPNYIKDNYYLIKTDGNHFVRIPKGRINSVFGSLARRTINYLEGDENAYEGWGKNAWSQIGIGDLGSNNIFAPITQAFGSENGTAWYGGDIVPTRLQDKPAGEQTDASIDAVSNFIGENLGISPYKINYVLDQYTGGFGDVFLPMITPETTSGAETFVEHLVAPIENSFVVNSTDDNKYAGEFYNTKDELEKKSNSQYATDEDKLRYKYMSNVSKQMSDLYKEKREVQADTTLGNKEKYRKVQLIQNEINSLAKEAMQNYDNFSNTENYTSIGEYEYYKDADGEWNKVTDDEAEFTAGLNDAEKTLYYNTKNKISGITKEYTAKTKELDKDSPLRKQYASERKENITRAITNSGLDNYSKAMIYSKYYSDKDTMTNVANAGYNVDTYINALYDIEEIRNKYSKNNGYTTEQRKAKTIAYINSLDMNIPQKAMLVRQYYSSYRNYNDDIVQYVNSLNIPYEDKVAILKGTGMTVNGNKVRWN